MVKGLGERGWLRGDRKECLATGETEGDEGEIVAWTEREGGGELVGRRGRARGGAMNERCDKGVH